MPLNVGAQNLRAELRARSRATEVGQRDLRLPSLIDVDPIGFDGIRCHDKVETPGCPARLFDRRERGGQEGVAPFRSNVKPPRYNNHAHLTPCEVGWFG